MGSRGTALKQTHCAYVNVFRAGFQGSFIFENAISKLYLLFKVLFFCTHIPRFSKK